MSKLTMALAELAKRADAGDEASLMFLHNTSAEKLQRVQDMGGMPMPSIAITDKDIPFENFGDITLVGKPESFDPKSSSLNQAFSADAYTVRAPRPVRIAKKGAGKRFQELYGADAKELDVYAADTVANVWDLEKKGDVREDKYDQVVRWFDDRSGPIFLKDKGIPFNKESRQDIDEKLQPFRQSGEFKQWADNAVDELFEPNEYFVANPDRDYYTQKAKLTPYTADEITKVMKRSAGRGGEGGMSTGSPGAVRAAYSEKLTSLDAMRKRKDQLSGDIGIEKGEIENLLFDLGDALKPYYKYDPNGWSYRDAVSELMTEGATRGLKRSADFVGFENIPKDLMSELEGFQQILKKAPTEYFESKPKRVVQLNEFGGAIVPEGTSQSTIDLLTKQGLEIEQYADDAQRLEARKKFKKLLFQLPPVIATTIAGAVAAGSAPEAQAGSVSSALVDLAKRAVAGDTDAATEIAKYGGAGRILDQFGDPRSMDMSNLDQVPNVQQFGLERYNPPRGRPANLDPLLTDEAAQRMEGFARRGENRGGRAWYNTQPLRDEFISELGESEGAAAFDRYMDIVAATSPRSRVDANIRRSSYLYGEDRAGRPIAGLTNADFPPGYGHLAHLTQDASLKDLEGGRSFQSLDRPKTSSFAENLKGNQQPMTIDTHNFSAITGDNKNKKSPSGTQYKYLEDFQVEIANKLNMTPAQFQASVWMGAETGVADARPFLEVFDDVVARTAKRNDVSKQKALTDFIRGDAPLYGLAAVMTGGAIVPQDAQASEYPSLGGMGVRMPPAAEDEEAMLAPTGGDLMQQANRDFAGAIRTQPEPDFLTGVQQSLLSGIMKTAGVADLSADVVSAMAGPLLSAPGAIARYAADRYVPGVNYTAEEMAQGRRETEDYFNYQPRTEQGPQYGEQIMQGIGGAIAPYVPAIKKAAGDSYILGAMRQGYDYLGEREKELAKALMDLSPI